MKIVILGLSLTSSWGNGHATTYRGLMRGLCARGHDVLFLERDVPWYAAHRDLPSPPYGRTVLYRNLEELKDVHAAEVREADLAMVGSYVPEGIAVGEWVTRTARGLTAFYDIDTPVTLAKLATGDAEYLSRRLVPEYDLYLSFTGGPTLQRLVQELKAKVAQPLYCSFEPSLYFPEPAERIWDLGYLGTYSACRQPPLERLLIEPARRWPQARVVVAGPQYPEDLTWPANVHRIEHLAPPDHRRFYNSQRFTLNVTRSDRVAAGYSPSVRLFEAAACGTPILSDPWRGLETFFTPGQEILIARSTEEAIHFLRDLSEEEVRRIGDQARQRALREHTADHRAEQLESYVLQLRRPRRARAKAAQVGA